MALAADNAPLRDALYSVGAAHWLTITKDSSYRTIELQYKGRAIRGMIALMNDLDDTNRDTQDLLPILESLLGCAVLLSWFAANRYVA